MSKQATDPAFLRLLERSVPVTETGCWLFEGTWGHAGHGQAWDGAKLVRAHRLSYEHHHGPIPEGLNVLHRCDVPPCIRPDHLFLGTQADNMADMNRKGRRGRCSAKLDASDAEAIRSLRGVVPGVELAKRFGCSRATICDIQKGRSWNTSEE